MMQQKISCSEYNVYGMGRFRYSVTKILIDDEDMGLMELVCDYC
jgi:hypothetical protein